MSVYEIAKNVLKLKEEKRQEYISKSAIEFKTEILKELCHEGEIFKCYRHTLVFNGFCVGKEVVELFVDDLVNDGFDVEYGPAFIRVAPADIKEKAKAKYSPIKMA